MQTTQTIIVCSKCGSDKVDRYLGPHNYTCWRCRECEHDTQQEWMTDQRSWRDESDNQGRLLRKVMV